MIGAIKRRWKSKKAKVLHKGTELSSSSDTCPTSRAFATESTDDFDKMIKPPSPRQIHPVLEKGDNVGGLKYGQLPPLTPTGLGRSHRKSSTLPPNSDELTDASTAFIHVNSGRIELVSRKGSPTRMTGDLGQDNKLIWRKRSHLLKTNDTRHSWCGSALGTGVDVGHPRRGMVSLVEEDRGPPRPTPPCSPPPIKSVLLQQQQQQKQQQDPQASLAQFLNPLRDRLTLIEELTKGLEGLQKEEKCEYERCVSELAGQVSRAVALQQIMKSEVEKLQMRVVHLENNNKAMATMILPTLMKLHETVVKEGPNSEKSATNTKDNLNPGQKHTIEHQQQSQEPKSSKEKKSPLKSLQSCQSDKELEDDQIKKKPPRLQKSPIKHRKIGECRIPRMSNGQLRQNSGTNSNTNSKANTKSESSTNKIISTSSSSNNKSNNEDNNQSQSESSLVTSPKILSTGIPRLASPLMNHQKTRKSVSDLPLNPSKLPVRKTASSGSNIPTKHPAASSKSLPNQPCPNNNNNRSSYKPNSGKNSKCSNPIGPNVPKKSPPCSSISSSSSNSSRPLQKLGSTGKDEGYSTMSSEALAEQEAGLKSPKKPGVMEKHPGFIHISQASSSSLHKSNTFNTLGEMKPAVSKTEFRNHINYTSLPKSPNSVQITTTVATASVFEPTSITTTHDNVRIVGGSPYEIHFSPSVSRQEDSASWDEQETSTSTILWEDSDDSDILFLPVEISSEDSGSQSTLLPQSERSSSYTSWTSASGPSSSEKHPYPLRRSKGEEFTPNNSNNSNKALDLDGGGTNVLIITTNTTTSANDERALIEKWMRLEDVRNEVQWEEEWAWDWEGVERAFNQSKSTRSALEGHPGGSEVINEEETEDDDEVEEFWLASCSNEKQQTSPLNSNPNGLIIIPDEGSHPPTFSSIETGKETHEGCSTSSYNNNNPQSLEIDSSTWTKSTSNKMRKLLENEEEDSCKSPESFLHSEALLINENGSHLLVEDGDTSGGVNDGSSSPPVIEFTPEFYRLANYGSNLSFSDANEGCQQHPNRSPIRRRNSLKDESTTSSNKMDDKISQTDFLSSLDNLEVSSDLFSECRNCLEIIKTLVGQTGESDNSLEDFEDGTPTNSKRLSEFERRIAEMKADAGCPTTWLNVPQGVPSKEVDRILEILSSSESEDVLSPSK